jgi:hypothetical protein
VSQPLRESPRAPVSFAAILEIDDGKRSIRVRVVDISESGARLKGPLEDASGDGELQLESGLKVSCSVVRPGPDSCGLRFGKLSEKQRAALRQLLSPLVRSFEEEAVLTPRGPVELSAEGLLSGEMYERFGLEKGCSLEELEMRGMEILASVEDAIKTTKGERKRRLTAVRRSIAHVKGTWTDAEARAVYDKHAGLDSTKEVPVRGVQGHLEDISAAELIGALADGRRNAELQIHRNGMPRGLVVIEGGACVGAHTSDTTAEEALAVVARYKTGLFYVHYGEPRAEAKNMSGTAQALREAADQARELEDPPDQGVLPMDVQLDTPIRDDRKASGQRTTPPTSAEPRATEAAPAKAAPRVAPARSAPPAKDNSAVFVIGAMILLIIVVVVVLSGQ